jgi:multiple sugar transport system ATP-binding protein
MKDGYIQQVGAPKDIYDNPNNIFVGGFIGTPAMNFISGHVSGQFFEAKGMKVKIPPVKLKKLEEQGFTKKPVILGIRPEDIHDEQVVLETYKDSTVHFKVDVSELLGAETNIYATVGDADVIARVDARADIKIGDELDLALDMNKCHFFDPDTELRIQ